MIFYVDGLTQVITLDLLQIERAVSNKVEKPDMKCFKLYKKKKRCTFIVNTGVRECIKLLQE